MRSTIRRNNHYGRHRILNEICSIIFFKPVSSPQIITSYTGIIHAVGRSDKNARIHRDFGLAYSCARSGC